MQRHNSRQTQYCDFCQLQARGLDRNLAERTARFVAQLELSTVVIPTG
jgi:lipoate synthase